MLLSQTAEVGVSSMYAAAAATAAAEQQQQQHFNVVSYCH